VLKCKESDFGLWDDLVILRYSLGVMNSETSLLFKNELSGAIVKVFVCIEITSA
jgi:hypothetical protein